MTIELKAGQPKMKKMSQEELDQVLEQHALWLQSGGDQGARANLTHTDLSRAYLYRTNLWRASLTGANLSDAWLSGANLSDAWLSGANLSDADLTGAYLYGADLSGAQLSGANLSGADLSNVSLSHVDLSSVYLYQTNLTQTQINADTRLHQCLNFKYLTCSSDALPWLILHPRWSDWKSTVTVVEDSQK